jgi:F-type H+-transporting ATPase subunit a
VVGGLNAFICRILGPSGRAHTPFIGTLFLYILVMNWMGLVPLFHSPVAHAGTSPIGLPIPTTTLPLAICSVIYVNVSAIRTAGLKGYCLHMLGISQEKTRSSRSSLGSRRD